MFKVLMVLLSALMITSCSNTTKVSPIEPQERLLEPDASCMVESLPSAKHLETGSSNGDMLATLQYNNYLWKQDRITVKCLQDYVKLILKDQNSNKNKKE